MQISNVPKTYVEGHNVVYSCQYHTVFCCKFTRDSLDGQVQSRIKQIIEESQVELGFMLISIITTTNYVHLHLEVDPAIGINNVVTRIKNKTSNILRKEFPKLSSSLPSLWTHHRFISTCGDVSLDEISTYIESQSGK